MTEPVACAGLDTGAAMPSVAALSELWALLDSLSSQQGRRAVENIPVEARNEDIPQDTGATDEPRAL